MKLILTTLLLSLLTTSLYSQLLQKYKARLPDTLCSKTISLYPDATYFYQSGCEAAPQVSYGKWSLKKDTVTLEPFNPATYPVIKNIAASVIPGDSIWVTVLDQSGANMTSKISIGLEVAGRGSYMFSSDSSGTKKLVYKRSGGKIVLRTLNKLFGRPFDLETTTANSFMITLNLNAGWVQNTHATWENTGKLNFLKKGNTLVEASLRLPKRLVFEEE